MQKLFSPDSWLMRGMSRLGDLMLLNFFFLITCIPIGTIGPAVTAMYTVCFRFGTDRERGVVRSYFAAFRENFKQGIFIWLIFLLCFVTACVNVFLFLSLKNAAHFLFLLFAVLALLALLIVGYAFPLLSQFNSSTKRILENALLMSIGYLPRSLLIVALNIFPFVLLLLQPYYFLAAGLIWFLFYFASAAFLNTRLLHKVFAPYMAPEENETGSTDSSEASVPAELPDTPQETV